MCPCKNRCNSAGWYKAGKPEPLPAMWFAYVDIVGVTGSIPVAPTIFCKSSQGLSDTHSRSVNQTSTECRPQRMERAEGRLRWP
jgi:hypothetical protein